MAWSWIVVCLLLNSCQRCFLDGKCHEFKQTWWRIHKDLWRLNYRAVRIRLPVCVLGPQGIEGLRFLFVLVLPNHFSKLETFLKKSELQPCGCLSVRTCQVAGYIMYRLIWNITSISDITELVVCYSALNTENYENVMFTPTWQHIRFLFIYTICNFKVATQA